MTAFSEREGMSSGKACRTSSSLGSYGESGGGAERGF